MIGHHVVLCKIFEEVILCKFFLKPSDIKQVPVLFALLQNVPGHFVFGFVSVHIDVFKYELDCIPDNSVFISDEVNKPFYLPRTLFDSLSTFLSSIKIMTAAYQIS